LSSVPARTWLKITREKRESDKIIKNIFFIFRASFLILPLPPSQGNKEFSGIIKADVQLNTGLFRNKHRKAIKSYSLI